ncbi:Zn-ribbon domain-containing OB-fold protein [Salipiger sp.]|uniref:Zn-ribbon domain-containing OB-fold protein n=1 Tax=Salipiger sp. TaxID=2078585 RepID=UPI003A971FA6
MTEIPLPPLDGPELPFWQGLKVREVRVQQCGGCGRHRFPAAAICTACGSSEAAWVAVAPRGTVDSHCTFHKVYLPGFQPPYTVILVRLDSGAKVFSNLVGDTPPHIGMAVEAVFEPLTDDVTLLKFRPA